MMTLRELIAQLAMQAGDMDEEVIVRIITRYEEIGSVDDSKTIIAPVARIGILGLPVSTIVVEAANVKPEQTYIRDFVAGASE